MSIPIETLVAATPEQLGQQLLVKLNAGYLLKGFKKEADSFLAFISKNEKPMSEMELDDINKYLDKEAKDIRFSDIGLSE